MVLYLNECIDHCPLSFYTAEVSSTSVLPTTKSTTTTTQPTSAVLTSTHSTATTNTTTKTTTTITTTQLPISTTESQSVTTNMSSSSSENTVNSTVTLCCKPCSEGCMRCVTDIECLECVTGYNLTVYGTCRALDNVLIQYLKSHTSVAYISVSLLLCAIAIVAFLSVFCILQIMEPDSCVRRQSFAYKEVDTDDAEYGKLSGLLNGKNGFRYSTKKLLDSSDSD